MKSQKSETLSKLTTKNNKKGVTIHIDGIVQGVGFRPFIYNQALKNQLTGWVRNSSSGVDVQLYGDFQNIDNFIKYLKSNPPALSQIDLIETNIIPYEEYHEFIIAESDVRTNGFQPISPDISTCNDCLKELFDPKDQRYLYPFINCTNCGPRFTIIKDIPYDRPNTTMQNFNMCSYCEGEYHDPHNRRFHAQPIACPKCGPHIWLEEVQKPAKDIPSIKETQTSKSDIETLKLVQELLIAGKIIAVKGLGGFHLACDATNSVVINKLRERKLRVDKPFAVMMANTKIVQKYCFLNSAEKNLIESRNRPIVILKRKPNTELSDQIAPYQNTIGVMLPYTPLHYLLFHSLNNKPTKLIDEDNLPSVLIMTSGNISEEPIAFDNEDARERLSSLVDYFLFHDRPIYTRCDDSVIRHLVINKSKPTLHTNNCKNNYYIRRSRGYAPNPLRIPWDSPPILATGTELKNTFCLTHGKYAFISHHIGDLENYETLKSYEESIAHYQHLFKVQPEYIAYDLHPDYLATHYALNRAETEKKIAFGIQHHHAHIASCMIENQIPSEEVVLGIALDGTGYGEDGTIWGGEFFLTNYLDYQRLYHLDYCPLPGGDIAIKKPSRTALAYLWNSGIEWDASLPPLKDLSTKEINIIHSQLVNKINSPLTSSMGRLFDAVASIIGVRHTSNYEAQAAIELESLIDPSEKSEYKYEILTFKNEEKNKCGRIDTKKIIKQIVDDYQTNITPSKIASRFHNTITSIILDIVYDVTSKFGVKQIVLSGGVWQNITLLEKVLTALKSDDLEINIHHQVPPNDGGVSLGQAAIAIHRANN